MCFIHRTPWSCHICHTVTSIAQDSSYWRMCATLCHSKTAWYWNWHSAVSSVWDTSAHLVFCKLGTTVCHRHAGGEMLCAAVCLFYSVYELYMLNHRLPGSDIWGKFTKRIFALKALIAYLKSIQLCLIHPCITWQM